MRYDLKKVGNHCINVIKGRAGFFEKRLWRLLNLVFLVSFSNSVWVACRDDLKKSIKEFSSLLQIDRNS